jgi:uncharacterized cupredoxin-like copper-binding protein
VTSAHPQPSVPADNRILKLRHRTGRENAMTEPSGSTSVRSASISGRPPGTDTGGGEPEPSPGGGTQRAWAAIGLIALGAIGLVAAFFLVTRDNATAPVASSAATDQSAAVAPAAPVAPATGPVTVSLSEFKVSMPATIAAGQVTLNIRNDGTVAHELLVFKSPLQASQYPKVNGGIDEEGPGITKDSDGDNLDPGTTQTRTVDLSAPGTYVFVCNLPGHFAADMYTTVVVK